MKKFITPFICLLILILVTACSDERNCDFLPKQELITPQLRVMVADPLSSNPFTGILEVYPCNEESSIYYGNYVNGKLTVFNGYYTVLKGHISGEYDREIKLPIGSYNMVYWGTPKYNEPIYNSPAISHPGLTSGADLSKLYFSLRSNNDGTYMPVYDLVHAIKETEIGKEDLQASLNRVGAALKIIVKKKDGSAFSSDVTSMQAHIGSIAEKLNFYTAEPENMSKTVKFDLTRSEDGTTMSNATVMLFPSAENPLLKIFITLQDGSVHEVSKVLNSTLAANTKFTLNISIGKILSGADTGDFTIENWNEEGESIDFPIIN